MSKKMLKAPNRSENFFKKKQIFEYLHTIFVWKLDSGQNCMKSFIYEPTVYSKRKPILKEVMSRKERNFCIFHVKSNL